MVISQLRWLLKYTPTRTRSTLLYVPHPYMLSINNQALIDSARDQSSVTSNNNKWKLSWVILMGQRDQLINLSSVYQCLAQSDNRPAQFIQLAQFFIFSLYEVFLTFKWVDILEKETILIKSLNKLFDLALQLNFYNFGL